MEPNRIDPYFLKQGIQVTYNALGATELLCRSYIQASRQLMPEDYEQSNHIKQAVYKQSWSLLDRPKYTGFESFEDLDQKLRAELDSLYKGQRSETHELWQVNSDDNLGSYRSNLSAWVNQLDIAKVNFYFSGGMDSEVVLRTMISQGRIPRVIIYKFTHSKKPWIEVGNQYDYYYALGFCQRHGIEPLVRELDLALIWDSAEIRAVSQEIEIVSPQILTHIFMIKREEEAEPGRHHIFGDEVRYMRSPFESDTGNHFLIKTNLTKSLGYNGVIYQAFSRELTATTVPYFGTTNSDTFSAVTITVTQGVWNISRCSIKVGSNIGNMGSWILVTDASLGDPNMNYRGTGGFSGSPITGTWTTAWLPSKYETAVVSTVQNAWCKAWNGVEAPSIPQGITQWKNFLLHERNETYVFTLDSANRSSLSSVLATGNIASGSGASGEQWKPMRDGFKHDTYFRQKDKPSVISYNPYYSICYWKCAPFSITGFSVATNTRISWSISRFGSTSDFQPILIVVSAVYGTSASTSHPKGQSDNPLNHVGTMIAYKWFDVPGAGDNLGPNTGRYAADANSGTLDIPSYTGWTIAPVVSFQIHVLWDGNHWTRSGPAGWSPDVRALYTSAWTLQSPTNYFIS